MHGFNAAAHGYEEGNMNPLDYQGPDCLERLMAQAWNASLIPKGAFQLWTRDSGRDACLAMILRVCEAMSDPGEIGFQL